MSKNPPCLSDPAPRGDRGLLKAIFLDRDGTLNVDSGYVHRLRDWQWLPGALEALALFRSAGWLAVVASNQSGIGRGYFEESDLKRLEAAIDAELRQIGTPIAAWYYCPHAPDQVCSCRKPKPGLLLRAAEELGIDPGASWMLGDRLRDVEAGHAAGCRTGLILNPACPAEARAVATSFPGTRLWPSLLEAAREIVGVKE